MTMAHYCTVPFIIIISLSQYDLNIVERDLNYKIIIISLDLAGIPDI